MNKPLTHRMPKIQTPPPECYHCKEPVKLHPLRIQGKIVRRVAQGYLCFRCEPKVAHESVELDRKAYLELRKAGKMPDKNTQPKWYAWATAYAKGSMLLEPEDWDIVLEEPVL